MAYRMVYLSHAAPHRPRSIPVAGRSAQEATQLAERVASVAGWILLTVVARRRA